MLIGAYSNGCSSNINVPCLISFAENYVYVYVEYIHIILDYFPGPICYFSKNGTYILFMIGLFSNTTLCETM